MSTLSSKFPSCIRYASRKFSGKQRISLLKQSYFKKYFLIMKKKFLKIFLKISIFFLEQENISCFKKYFLIDFLIKKKFLLVSRKSFLK